ncbi:MAG: ROK family transcriptional regulator [Lentisphaeria bacterium]|nr:ROK family transcriptional regulator [Lentisphaeria bacterium]
MSGKTQQSGKRRVFNLLRTEGGISRASLSQRCGLTRPAVSAIVDELVREGLVLEAGRGYSTGGKPPILLKLVPGGRCAIGLDLGDDYLIRGVLCDCSCEVLSSAELEYSNNCDDIVNVSSRLINILASQAPAGSLVGVGAAVSGVVDAEKNEIAGSTTLDIAPYSGFAACLQRKTNLPVILERRPNAAALAEALFGSGKNYTSLIYLTSGRGVGAGIFINGEIYRGRFGSAGEIGLLRLPGGGRVEEIARPSTVAAEFSRLKGRNNTFAEFLAAFRNGDPDAEHLARLNAEQLAFAAETAANLFDTEAVILGGRALEFGERWFNYFKHILELNSTSGAVGGKLCVERSFFGSSGVAVGGAQVVLDRIIK